MDAATKADLILVIHYFWVLFVVFSVPVIIFGAVRKWEWTRNSWFRNIHLAMIAIVVFEAVTGIDCPLTVGEQELRRAAGMESYEGSFVAHLFREFLYLDLPIRAVNVLHISWGILIFAFYIFWPPRSTERLVKSVRGIRGRVSSAR